MIMVNFSRITSLIDFILPEYNRRISQGIMEHDKCCQITMEINSWLKDILFIYYYLIVPFIDLAVLYILWEPSLTYRFTIAFLVVIITINLFIVNHRLCVIGSEAHKCYKTLN